MKLESMMRSVGIPHQYDLLEPTYDKKYERNEETHKVYKIKNVCALVAQQWVSEPFGKPGFGYRPLIIFCKTLEN